MIHSKHVAAVLGFAFIAAWIGFGFGRAILCLIGALVFYAIVGIYQGELDLGELQSRMQGSRRSPSARSTTSRGQI
jgi:hypothetical protein